jgi:cytohesin
MDQTDLHKAAYEGDAERVKELLKKGANPNTKDKKGRTPLHEAAQWGRLDVVELLLVRGADPTVKDKDGRTPLDLARAEGHRKVVSVIKGWLRQGGGPSRRRF